MYIYIYIYTHLLHPRQRPRGGAGGQDAGPAHAAQAAEPAGPPACMFYVMIATQTSESVTSCCEILKCRSLNWLLDHPLYDKFDTNTVNLMNIIIMIFTIHLYI